MQWMLTRGRAPVLVALLSLTAFFGWQASRLGVEMDNESLNTRDAARAEYDRFREVFGNDEDLLLAVSDPHLLAASGLQRIDRLTRAVAAVDGVRHVFSLTTAKQLIPGPGGAEEAPLVAPPFDASDIGTRLTSALTRNPDFTGWLISVDRRTAGILIEIEDRPGDHRYRAAVIAALRDLIAEYEAPAVTLHLTGIAVQKHDVAEYVRRDQMVLMPLALAILTAILALFFRRSLGIALPLAVTGISVTWTLGSYHLAGFQMNAITALLPPVIMVLSVSVSVHLVQEWLQMVEEREPLQRIRRVVDELWVPCLFCSITTALGLSSLAVAEMPAVRQFGLFASVGVLSSFVVGMTLVPIGLTFLTPPQQVADTPQHRLLRRVLDWSAELAIRHPGSILVVFTAVTVIAVAGIPRIHNNTDLIRFLRSDAPLFRDTMFIDQHLTGAQAIELVIRHTDGRPMTDAADWQRLERLEQAIRREPDVTTVVSVLAVLRQMARAERGDERLELPDNQRDLTYLFDLLQAVPDRSLIGKLVDPEIKQIRLSIRVRAVGTAVAAPLAERIRRTGEEIMGAGYDVTPTGAFYYIARDSNRLVEDQVSSFAVGLLAVSLAIAALFRAIRPTIISLIPNVMPLLWTGGLMGFFGIDLSTGTAMIGSAVIGLVVDDTIHYLAQFYKNDRGDAAAAVRETTTGVGAALVMNNLVLVFGFWVGCFGSFKPTIYFSLLTGLTMITAMICDLFVTPACLMLLDRRRRSPAA